VIDEEVLLEATASRPRSISHSALELGRRCSPRSAPRPDRMNLAAFNVTEGALTCRCGPRPVEGEGASWTLAKGRLKDLLEVETDLALAQAKRRDPDRRWKSEVSRGERRSAAPRLRALLPRHAPTREAAQLLRRACRSFLNKPPTRPPRSWLKAERGTSGRDLSRSAPPLDSVRVELPSSAAAIALRAATGCVRGRGAERLAHRIDGPGHALLAALSWPGAQRRAARAELSWPWPPTPPTRPG